MGSGKIPPQSSMSANQP